MSLNRKLVESYQSLFRDKYGEHISYALAESELLELAELVRMTVPKEDIK